MKNKNSTKKIIPKKIAQPLLSAKLVLLATKNIIEVISRTTMTKI